MAAAGSKKQGFAYVPAIRDSRRNIVWMGSLLCGNRDETTWKNVGASHFARLVLMSILDREKMQSDVDQPVPAALWNGGHNPYAKRDWDRLQNLKRMALETADEIPSEIADAILNDMCQTVN